MLSRKHSDSDVSGGEHPPPVRGEAGGFSEQRKRVWEVAAASVASLSAPRGSWRGAAVWTRRPFTLPPLRCLLHN